MRDRLGRIQEKPQSAGEMNAVQNLLRIMIYLLGKRGKLPYILVDGKWMVQNVGG
jgi:hypothetical protein